MNDQFDEDKREKQSLVLATVASHCNISSPHQGIRDIARELASNKNAKLEISNVAGGVTNYTYKIFISTKPSLALFAKLCFPRALWNPDPDYYYDVERITNEYEMMKRFATLAPGQVATPYLLIDIDDMMLLVTQWSPADEQLANQFIDGVVDVRVMKNLGVAVAALHCSEIDPEFNTETRECMIDVFPLVKERMLSDAVGSSKDDKNSRAVKLAQEYGKDLCSTIADGFTESYRAKDIAVHADLHAFNCLVEKKPDISQLEQFGLMGTVVVCDWEMAMCGPLGIDHGRVFCFPVACVITHAINGDDGKVTSGILESLDMYWGEYAAALKERGKSDDFLKRSFLNTMGWLGWLLYVIIAFDLFKPYLPIEKASIVKLDESMLVLALKLMRMEFVDHNINMGLSLKALQCKFHNMIHDELSIIKSSRELDVAKTSQKRRSSVLRKMNRRVSDSSWYSSITKERASFSFSITEDDEVDIRS